MINKYTYVKEADVWICNDCGAHGITKEDIEHHDTCKPGESEKWEKIYSEEGE